MTKHSVKAAKLAREVLGKNYVVCAPVRIEEIVANYGLAIFEADFTSTYAHVAGLIDMEDETIYVNRDDSAARKAFTIAHELGHFLMHPEKVKEDPDKYSVLYRYPLGAKAPNPLEAEANCFAAHLLVPDELLADYLNENPQMLARIFGVPLDVVVYRLQHLND